MSTQSEASPHYYGGLGPGIVGVSWSLFGVATILLVLRIYTHFAVVKNKGGWALILACVAWCLGFPSSILYTYAAKYGLGNHVDIVGMAPKLSTALLYEWIAANTISYSVFFGKLSVLMYILDVQSRTNNTGKWILIFTVSLNGIFYLGTTAMIFTQCDPPAKLWNAALPGNCNGVHRALIWAFITGGWGTLTDFMLALYPIFIIWNLHIKKQLKLVISFLMGLGVVTAVCSLVKTIQFPRLTANTDATYAIAPLMILGMTEMWVVLIASSAAPLWPLFRTRAMTRSQAGTYGNHSKVQGLFNGSKKKGYKKTSREMMFGERDLYSSDIAAGDRDSDGSQENMVDVRIPNEGIMLTRGVTVTNTVRHEDGDGKGTTVGEIYV